MQRGITTKPAQPALPGVIETIAEGLSVVLVRPALMLVPILLDVYLWLGWKITLSPLTGALAGRVRDVEANGSDSAELIRRLDDLGKSDASWLLSVQTPSLVSSASRPELYSWRPRPELVPDSWWLSLLVGAGIVLAAALLPMIFAVPIADAAVSRQRAPRALLRAILIAWVRFLLLVGLILVLAALAMVPFIIGGIALLLGGAPAEPLLGLGGFLVVVTALVLLSFAPDAIVVSEVGPVRAIRNSIRVVRSAFWQSVGLVAASTLISIGLGELFLRMAESAPGLALGVLLNAYVATGLALASMLFYSSRIRSLLPEAVAR